VATTSRTVAPALKALLEQFIDYAGTFPPAALPMGDAVTNFQKYAAEDYSWMLRFLVVSSADLDRVPNALDGRLSIIADKDEQRAASIESKSAVASKQPVYCEVAPGNTAELDAVKKAGCFAKIRTGGLKPEAILRPHKLHNLFSIALTGSWRSRRQRGCTIRSAPSMR
jgi:hypothetical protein